MKRCSRCSANLDWDRPFCPFCGGTTFNRALSASGERAGQDARPAIPEDEPISMPVRAPADSSVERPDAVSGRRSSPSCEPSDALPRIDWLSDLPAAPPAEKPAANAGGRVVLTRQGSQSTARAHEENPFIVRDTLQTAAAPSTPSRRQAAKSDEEPPVGGPPNEG